MWKLAFIDCLLFFHKLLCIYSAEWSFGDNMHRSNSLRDYGLPELLCSDSHMVALWENCRVMHRCECAKRCHRSWHWARAGSHFPGELALVWYLVLEMYLVLKSCDDDTAIPLRIHVVILLTLSTLTYVLYITSFCSHFYIQDFLSNHQN